MMAKIFRTSWAEVDLAEIWTYIANDDIQAADRLIHRIDERFQLLLENPNMGDSMEQYRAGLRATAVGKYVVFFKRVPDGIEIYRVLHGARRREDHL